MEVILLESVENLGGIGDHVKVKPGYGRNFLLPQGKAALATKANMKAIEARRAELEKAAAAELKKAQARAKSFSGVELVVPANAGSEGKLFGSVGPSISQKRWRRSRLRSSVRKFGCRMARSASSASSQLAFTCTVKLIPRFSYGLLLPTKCRLCYR